MGHCRGRRGPIGGTWARLLVFPEGVDGAVGAVEVQAAGRVDTEEESEGVERGTEEENKGTERDEEDE